MPLRPRFGMGTTAGWGLHTSLATHKHENIGLTESTFAGVTVTAGSANTKGSYATIGTPSFDADGFFFNVPGVSNNTAFYLADIAVGNGSTPDIVWPDLMLTGNGSTGNTGLMIYLPIPLKANIQVKVRCQSSTGSATLDNVHISPYRNTGFPGATKFSEVTAYGVTSASSRGTTIDPGSSGGSSEGSYAQLNASVKRMRAAMVVFMRNQVYSQTQIWVTDLSTGAGGAEVVQIGNMHTFIASTTVLQTMPWHYFIPTLQIGAGQRLSARARGLRTANNTFDLVVYGLY